MNNDIIGVFKGEYIVTDNGLRYPIQQNYASKSKLVEGDVMALKITDDGQFIYKLTKPVQRRRLMAEVVVDDETGEMKAATQLEKFKMLSSSISYYKIVPGKKLIIAVPMNIGEEVICAIEGVIE